MSLDATQIVIQTLETQISSLKEREEVFNGEISEHKGAQEICEQMAPSVLKYADLVEKHLQEDLFREDISEETAQVVRKYAKNLIIRLHNVCSSNAKSQCNEGFVVRGKLAEAKAQAEILRKQIINRQAFAAGKVERDAARDAKIEFDISDLDTDPFVSSAIRPEPLPAPSDVVSEFVYVSEPILEGEGADAPMVFYGPLLPPSYKKLDGRLHKKKQKIASPPAVDEEPPTPPTEPGRRNIHKRRGFKGNK